METGGNKTVSRLSRNASRFKSQNNSTFTHNIETFLRNKFPPALSLNTQDCQFIQNIFFLRQVLIYVLYSYFEPLLYLKYMKMSIESFSQSFWFLAFVKILVRCSTWNKKMLRVVGSFPDFRHQLLQPKPLRKLLSWIKFQICSTFRNNLLIRYLPSLQIQFICTVGTATCWM